MPACALVLSAALAVSGARARADAGRDSDSGERIWGKWLFSRIFYQGEIRPLPNPKLVLIFEFRPDGTDHLHWSRKGEPGSCEREGRYRYEGSVLHDEVVSVDPRNLAECSRDPDMLQGHESDTPLVRDGERLEMKLGLGDEALSYLFERWDERKSP